MADAPPAIRNVLQINPAADALGFAAAWLAAGARLVRMSELGGTWLATRLLPPAGAAIQAHLADDLQLTPDPARLLPVLRDLLPCRVAMLHRADRPDQLQTVLDQFAPDALCVAPAVGQMPATALAPFDPGHDLAECGLGGLLLFANAAGARALETSLAAYDAARRRRFRVREKVYGATEIVPVSGIYPVERDAGYQWAWTGPESIATFLMPLHGGEQARLTLFFFANTRPLDAQNLRVLVNGQEQVSRYFPDELKIEIELTGLADATFARIDLQQAVMVPTEDHSRRLGYALHKLKLEAA